MLSFKSFTESLWANIHKKRKEGRPMRKPGSKGAPTKAAFASARGEDVEEKKKRNLGSRLQASCSKNN